MTSDTGPVLDSLSDQGVIGWVYFAKSPTSQEANLSCVVSIKDLGYTSHCSRIPQVSICFIRTIVPTPGLQASAQRQCEETPIKESSV